MKKSLIFVMLMAICSLAFGQNMKLTNKTPCPITVSLRAHDATHVPCGLESNIFVIPAFGSVGVTSVISVNTGIGWSFGGPAGPGGVWDAIKFTYGGPASLLGVNCGALPLWNGPDCTGVMRTGTWTAFAGGVVQITFF